MLYTAYGCRPLCSDLEDHRIMKIGPEILMSVEAKSLDEAKQLLRKRLNAYQLRSWEKLDCMTEPVDGKPKYF